MDALEARYRPLVDALARPAAGAPARLVAVSLGLAIGALALAEWSNRRLRAWLHATC